MNPNPSTLFGIVVRAARGALQWRLLLLWAAWMLIPTAIMVLPMWQMLGAQLDYSVHAPALAHELDLIAIADLWAAYDQNQMAFGLAAKLALLATLLISPLLTGMAATAARARHGPRAPGFGALMAGALDQYPRMLRMLAWAGVALAIAAVIGQVLLDMAAEHDAGAVLQSSANLAYGLALLALGLMLMLVHATLDLGRAVLTQDRRCNSAVLAWWDGCKLLARRPWRTLGVYLAVSAPALALLALLTLGRIKVSGASMGGFIAALLLTELIVLVIAWMRCARLFAMLELASAHR
jgi:hypothetical protein